VSFKIGVKKMDAVLVRDILLTIIVLTNLTILIVVSLGIRVMVDAINKLSLHFGAMTNDPNHKPMLSYSKNDEKLSSDIYQSALEAMKKYRITASETKDIPETIFSTRQEADEVLLMLNQLIKNYHIAMLTDLYDFISRESVFEDHHWGWDDLSSATVKPFQDMWKLELPPLKLLEELQAEETVNELNPKGEA
jgi:hypothetical protein